VPRAPRAARGRGARGVAGSAEGGERGGRGARRAGRARVGALLVVLDGGGARASPPERPSLRRDGRVRGGRGDLLPEAHDVVGARRKHRVAVHRDHGQAASRDAVRRERLGARRVEVPDVELSVVARAEHLARRNLEPAQAGVGLADAHALTGLDVPEAS
jgi:hypothetical protein